MHQILSILHVAFLLTEPLTDAHALTMDGFDGLLDYLQVNNATARVMSKKKIEPSGMVAASNGELAASK